jgi:hypothetical protein
VVEHVRAAQLVDTREVLLDRLRDLLKNIISFSDPTGPPSGLAPLSEMSRNSVLSSCPISSRKLTTRPNS